MNDEELKAFIETLQAWHKNQVDQLKMISENKEGGFEISGERIEAGSEVAKGIRFGASLAVEMLGELPFKMTATEVEEADDDSEEHY